MTNVSSSYGSNSMFIEETLNRLCTNTDQVETLRGGYYVQPAFTLYCTLLVLLGFIFLRRVGDVLSLIWPISLADQCDAVVVMASMWAFSEQESLILQLESELPGISGAFPAYSFVHASGKITENELKSSFLARFLEVEEPSLLECNLEGSDEMNDVCEEAANALEPRGVLRQVLRIKLRSFEAADLILSRFTEDDCRLLDLLDGSPRQKVNTSEGSSEELKEKLSTDWDRWRDVAGDEELEVVIRVANAWSNSRDTAAQQDLALVFLFMEVSLALVVLFQFFFKQPWPEGHWLTCKIPYSLSVVSFKPFSVPMWACVTTVCPYSFAEATFGRHPKGRDASGTCISSSLPRNILSVGLMAIVTTMLFTWICVALFAYLYPLIVFSPVLLIPCYVVPLATSFFLTKAVDKIVPWFSRATGANEQLREHKFQIGDRVEVSNDREPWKTGIVRSCNDRNEAFVLTDEQGEFAIPRLYQNCRSQAVSEWKELQARYDETIFALRLATTQLIVIVMIAFPLVHIYGSESSWNSGAAQVVDVTLSFPSIMDQFKVSLNWPNFTWFRLNIQFAVGIALVAIQAVTRFGQSAVQSCKPNPWTTLRWCPNGSRFEQRLCFIFSLVSWYPFKCMQERTRSSFEGALLKAKRRKSTNNKTTLMKESLILCADFSQVLMLAPFQAINYDSRVKHFGRETRDRDLRRFCEGEGALWYSGLSCENSVEVTRIDSWLHECVWFKVIRIINCSNTEVSLRIIGRWLIFLTHLEIGASTELFQTTTALLECAATSAGLEHARLPWVVGSISSLRGLSHLTILNLSHTSAAGDIAVLQHLKALRKINMNGCYKITGSIGVFRHIEKLEECMLASTLVQGNIEIFRYCEGLTAVHFGQTAVEGDISVFSTTEKLTFLNLNQTKCSGSIYVFGSTPFLEVCDLDGTSSISGSIGIFEHTPDLTYLGLSQACCDGDIRVFGSTPRLRVLRLAQTEGRAQQDVFANMDMPATRSSSIRRQSQVKGSIQVFESTPKLRILDLHATSCHGDVVVFENTTKIVDINLNGTRSNGDVACFRKTPKLRSLNLWRTGVTGDVSVFINLLELMNLTLGFTGVRGDIRKLRETMPHSVLLI